MREEGWSGDEWRRWTRLAEAFADRAVWIRYDSDNPVTGLAAYHGERGVWLCGARIDPAKAKPVLAALRGLFEEQQKLALP